MKQWDTICKENTLSLHSIPLAEKLSTTRMSIATKSTGTIINTNLTVSSILPDRSLDYVMVAQSAQSEPIVRGGRKEKEDFTTVKTFDSVIPYLAMGAYSKFCATYLDRLQDGFPRWSRTRVVELN